jgi:hypothetical protein
MVADRVGIVDAWVDEGLAEATGLYEEALRKAGVSPSVDIAHHAKSCRKPQQDHNHSDGCCS